MLKPSAASSTIRASVRNILYKMKNYSFILIAFIAVLMTACKKTSHITGTIEDGKDGDTLFLISDVKNGIPMDTLFVKGGRFEYETEPDSTYLCLLRYGERIQAFFMEPGNIQISLKKDELGNIISGTKLNDEWQKLNSAASDYQKEMMRLTEEAKKDTSEQNMQAIMPKVMMAQNKLSDIYYQTAERNIQNELGFFLVSNPVALSEEQVLKLINQMPSKIHARKEIQEIERFLKSSAAQNAEGGSTISDFSAQSPDGKTINAMSVVSKHELTIIDFWASWCSPCMQEMPHMVELYKLYKDKGLGILGVSLDTDEEAWKNAISKTGASWDHISELKRNSEIANMFGVTAIPFTLLVDKEGHVLASGLVGNELEDFVRAQLN